MPHENSFDDVMERLRAGNADAAGEVFHRFANRLIGLARSRLDGRLRQKVDPEDVLQSVYKSFFRRQAETPFELQNWDNLWSLLTVITVRKCGSWIDRFHSGARDVDREVARRLAEDSSPSWEALAREPTPVEAAVLAETVQNLLAGLEERDRTIVSLSLQGYSVEEVSAQVGRTERTVYRVLERIKKHLEQLREEASEA